MTRSRLKTALILSGGLLLILGSVKYFTPRGRPLPPVVDYVGLRDSPSGQNVVFLVSNVSESPLTLITTESGLLVSDYQVRDVSGWINAGGWICGNGLTLKEMPPASSCEIERPLYDPNPSAPVQIGLSYFRGSPDVAKNREVGFANRIVGLLRRYLGIPEKDWEMVWSAPETPSLGDAGDCETLVTSDAFHGVRLKKKPVFRGEEFRSAAEGGK